MAMHFPTSEFKYLNNPNDFPFTFQYDGVEITLPPRSKKLLLKAAAEHGEKRSWALTDPRFDAEGNLLHAGNDVLQYCFCSDAEVTFNVEKAEPIVLEKAENADADATMDLGKFGMKPVIGSRTGEASTGNPMNRKPVVTASLRKGDMPVNRGPLGTAAPVKPQQVQGQAKKPGDAASATAAKHFSQSSEPLD